MAQSHSFGHLSRPLRLTLIMTAFWLLRSSPNNYQLPLSNPGDFEKNRQSDGTKASGPIMDGDMPVAKQLKPPERRMTRRRGQRSLIFPGCSPNQLSRA